MVQAIYMEALAFWYLEMAAKVETKRYRLKR